MAESIRGGVLHSLFLGLSLPILWRLLQVQTESGSARVIGTAEPAQRELDQKERTRPAHPINHVILSRSIRSWTGILSVCAQFSRSKGPALGQDGTGELVDGIALAERRWLGPCDI
jgi:hypothetical protein